MSIKTIREKMLDVITDVQNKVCERDELIHCIAVALLSSKNLFILGDTGQAKSYAVNEFCKRITYVKRFETLMSKQIDVEQLFGRLDLSSIIPGNIPKEELMKDNRYLELFHKLEEIKAGCETDFSEPNANELLRITQQLTDYKKMLSELWSGKPKMITAGKIPDSQVVFLDEIFKSNEGLLNSLLTAINERKWTNEGETIDIPVISFFSASNEIPNFNNPEEHILKPLYDRFDLKLLTNYVVERSNRLNMLRKKLSESSLKSPVTIGLDELYQMQAEVKQISVPDDMDELADDILCELRKKDIHVSDRKYFNYHPIVRAEAYLCGAAEVCRKHFSILKYYFWNTPEEIPVIDEVLKRFCENPLIEKLKTILTSASESFEQFKNTDNSKKALIKLRSEFVRLYDQLCTAFPDYNNLSADDKSIFDNHLGSLEKLSKEAHSQAGFTYTPLSELKILNQ